MSRGTAQRFWGSEQRAARSLALILVAALVPLIVFAVAATILSLRSQRQALEQDALAQTHRISTLVDAELNSQLDVLATLARSPTLDEPPDIAAFAAILRREQAAQPLWLAGLLADPEGNLLVDTHLPLPGRVVEMESLRKAVESRTRQIGPIAKGQTGFALPLRAPVIHDGAVRFVVVAVIKPDAIHERLLAAELPPEWTGTVIDASGHVVARSRGDPALVGGLASALALHAREGAEWGLYEGRLLEGTTTISAFRKSPATGWSVHIGIPREVFDAPLLRSAWIAAAGGSVSLALAALFIVLLLRELRARRAADEALEQARRMEGLGRLTGGVAHDFNNLLMVIIGNVGLLAPELPGGAAHPQLANIQRASDRGVEITRRLLAFSRSGSGGHSAVDINACLLAALGMMRQTLGPKIPIEFALAEGLPPVALDRVQLELALLNLAANARDAMPEGGTLTIATAKGMLPDGLAAVAVTVADTGTGFQPEARRRAFEPFFTTKELGRGTGLGLTQVYGFAHNAGGTVTIDSRPGEGARITILLPAQRETQAPPATGNPS
jgi:signal transduction histidine kinase